MKSLKALQTRLFVSFV